MTTRPPCSRSRRLRSLHPFSSPVPIHNGKRRRTSSTTPRPIPRRSSTELPASAIPLISDQTQLARAAGIEIEPVSFDGGGVLLTALLGGHIAVSAGSTVDYKPHIEAGKLRPLLSFGPTRSQDPLYKDVPTAKELGYDAEIVSWTGVAAPKGLPTDVTAKLNEAFKEAMADPKSRMLSPDWGPSLPTSMPLTSARAGRQKQPSYARS